MKYLTMLTLVVLATAACALDYWPEDPDGAIYTYRNPAGVTMTAEFQVDGERQFVVRNQGLCTYHEEFVVSESGVALASYGFMCEGAVDPNLYDCEPPIPMVTDVMTSGSTWDYSGTINGQQVTVQVSVGQDTIEVPMGTFEVAPVHLSFDVQPDNVPPMYWLDVDLGPVRIGDWDLVSVETTVAVQPQSWSAVKSLFD